MEDSSLSMRSASEGYGATAAPDASLLVWAPRSQAMGEALPGSALEADKEVENTWCPNLWSGLLCTVLAPCGIINGIKQINVKEQAAALYWGEYMGTLSKPGLYLLNPFGLELRHISTQRNTMQLKEIKVLDARGNPIVINGIVTFVGTSAKKAAVDVSNPWPVGRSSQDGSFLELQAAAVLKRVASRFPYEARQGEASLQTEGQAIGEELRRDLQEKVSVTGAMILAFDLVDLSYAPEIAQMMLVRQQAEALVDARKTLVSAAVDMTRDAVESLRGSEGSGLDEKTCQTITTNLLTVICSGTTAVPTLNVGS